MENSSKGSVMRSAAPNTNNPLRTRLKHIKLSPCPMEIGLQHKTNSLDTKVARRGVLQQVLEGQQNKPKDISYLVLVPCEVVISILCKGLKLIVRSEIFNIKKSFHLVLGAGLLLAIV